MYGGYGAYGGGGYGGGFGGGSSEMRSDMWIQTHVPGGLNSTYYRFVSIILNEIKNFSLLFLLI